jgi:hypothetical protein
MKPKSKKPMQLELPIENPTPWKEEGERIRKLIKMGYIETVNLDTGEITHTPPEGLNTRSSQSKD